MFKKKHSKPLPVELQLLINQAGANHQESREYRVAMAELSARTSESLNEATRSLRNATYLLVLVTFILVFVTFIIG